MKEEKSVIEEGNALGQEINDLFDKQKDQEIEVSEEAYKEVVRRLKVKLNEVCEKGDDSGSFLKDFFIRATILSLKVAAIHAILSNRRIINIEDANTGVEVMLVSLEMIQNEILEKGIVGKEQDVWIKDVRTVLGHRQYMKGVVEEKMMQKWGIGRTKTKNRIEKIKYVFHYGKGVGNTQYWSINW